ncbi:unnamed protein product [Pedinophyceae sp. YPF-701]|nr:unnamed protein product [Pedinophyceae sp. YPF-701]
MGLRDWVWGRKKEDAAPSAVPSESLTLPSSPAPPAQPDPVTAPAARMYNPYDGMDTGGIGGIRAVQSVYAMPQSPQFLFDAEAKIKRRSWGDNLAYYTGVGYLSGWLGGGAFGAATGIASSPEPGMVDTNRLKINRFLNSTASRGTRAGNALGMVGMIFALSESGLFYVGENHVPVDYPDALNTLAAGFLTGALFRAPRGPQLAAVAGGAGVAAAAALLAGRSVIKGL